MQMQGFTHTSAPLPCCKHASLPLLPLSLFCPQILEEQHALFFHLQQQRLIELIRAGKTEEALGFAQEYLAPHGEENEALLEELGERLRQ